MNKEYIAKDVMYLDSLQSGFRTRHFWTRFALSFAGVLSAVSFAFEKAEWLLPYAGVGIIILVLWDLLNDYGKHLSELRFAAEELGKVENQYMKLWMKIENELVDNNIALEKANELESMAITIFGKIDVSTDKKLNKKCHQLAFGNEEHRDGK